MAKGKKPASVQIFGLKQSLTPEQVAQILQCHVRTVHRLLKSGKLRGVKLMRDWRIHPEDLEAFQRGEEPPSRGDSGKH